MKQLFYFIALMGLFACQNPKKDIKVDKNKITENIRMSIAKEIQQKDSVYMRWHDQMYKSWTSCDSMPYFILDRQINRLLENPELSKADKIILNYQLVYHYYSRRFIYDSIQYRNKAIELLFKTFDSDKDLLYSSAYYKTTPDKFKKYINEIKNAGTDKVIDSLIWHRLDSDERLKDY
ncbi:MAG TPA: hypothetical protein DCR40_18905 [Prolixibacteraceae bacterium]|nr:hypothetical protein [Prolixibacteraceae bacterium]